MNGSAVDEAAPRLRREDVATELGIAPEVGFSFELPAAETGVVFKVNTADEELAYVVGALPESVMRAERRRLLLKFLAIGVANSVTALRWMIRRDPAARAKIKAALGLDPLGRAGRLEEGVFLTPADEVTYPTDQKITIILPVYNAFDLLPEVLDRIERNTSLRYRLLLIEDCSTDTQVRPFLRTWVNGREDRATLIENEKNLGFIGSVNRALEEAVKLGNHVVLLNSDAFVPAGWAERLIRPMFVHDRVASVTPMSNDAEIFSVPVICKRSILQPGQADAIDAIARTFHPEALLSVVPTGVGFCMALNIEYLRRMPSLDRAFGRGYGEEVDWCQKVRARGGRHLGLPGLFVEHRGGESFGSDEKVKLVRANNGIISRRYPGFDLEVQNFIRSDPMLTCRLALAIAQAASGSAQPVPVYLAHSLGGGADLYLEHRIAEDTRETGHAIVLRVGGPDRWRLEVIGREGTISGTTDSFAFVRKLLEPIQERRIIYSCGVGDPDPLELPANLIALKRGDRDRIEILVHDYFILSPSYCLLDNDDWYRGPPTADVSNAAHFSRRTDGSVVSPEAWLSAWGALVAAAEVVTVFSHDSRRQIVGSYPAAAAKITVRPHRLTTDVPRIAQAPGESGTYGILGNIGRQKGAAIVSGPSAATADRDDLSFVVIGNFDPAYKLHASTPVHGTYRVEDLSDLARRYGIRGWLIPSIWPETFSYTTHEALATGLRVFCFDLGAQGEAVRNARNGTVVPYVPGSDLVQSLLAAIEADRHCLPVTRGRARSRA